MVERPDEAINLLLDELELRANQDGSRSESRWVCQRKHPRSVFRAGCIVYFFPKGSATVTSLAGRTRNLSRTGVGLLVRRVFSGGEPVEVEIVLPDRPSMYLAGVVTFCRYAGRGFHEIGVFLKTAATEPIFFKNPLAAMETHPWLVPQLVPVSA
jgi:hypothetical protein